MEYKEVVKVNIEKAVIKRKEATDENLIKYWEWVISELIADLKDLVTDGTEAWLRKGERRIKFNQAQTFNDFFKTLFEGFWDGEV